MLSANDSSNLILFVAVIFIAAGTKIEDAAQHLTGLQK